MGRMAKMPPKRRAKTGRKAPTKADPQKYLLYIDMLGFSDLVRKKGQVKKLYEIIDTLNVHTHSNFRTLIFSDTILVYNDPAPENAWDRHYLIMYLCECAKDLFYRLIHMDLHFRAYLCQGRFNHEKMEHIEAFYGETLVRAYERESEIQCCGLFIETNLLPDCDIFHTDAYDAKCHFVHLMQSLDSTRFPDVVYPIDPILIRDTYSEWELAENVVYLRNVHRHMNDVLLPPRIRAKYAATWQMIRKRHKPLLETLEAANFNPRSISNFDWKKAMRHAVNPSR